MVGFNIVASPLIVASENRTIAVAVSDGAESAGGQTSEAASIHVTRAFGRALNAVVERVVSNPNEWWENPRIDPIACAIVVGSVAFAWLNGRCCWGREGEAEDCGRDAGFPYGFGERGHEGFLSRGHASLGLEGRLPAGPGTRSAMFL